MMTGEINKAFEYFGPQVCHDKVRSFLTPGYRVMKAEVGHIVKGRPERIILHEYDELNVSVKEFTRQFDEMDIQINVIERGGMEIVAVTNFPELVYSSIESKHSYQGISLIIHS